MSGPLDDSQTTNLTDADIAQMTTSLHESTTIIHGTTSSGDWSIPGATGWSPSDGGGGDSRRRSGSWNDMAHLNNRLGSYMDKVRTLEKKNSALSIEITRRELRYENELAKLRKQIEELERDKKRQADDHAAEIERLNREYDRVYSELTVFKEQAHQTARAATGLGAGIGTGAGGKTDQTDYAPGVFDEITLESIEVEYQNKLQENADRMRQYYEEQIIKTRGLAVGEFQNKLDRERAENRALLDRKDAENHDLRDDLKKQKDAHDELEYELRRYRVLLETGENRLNISDLDSSGISCKRIKLGFRTGAGVIGSAQKNLSKSHTSIRLITSDTSGHQGGEAMDLGGLTTGWADVSEAGSDISEKDRMVEVEARKTPGTGTGTDESSSWVRPAARLHREKKKASKKETAETPKSGKTPKKAEESAQ